MKQNSILKQFFLSSQFLRTFSSSSRSNSTVEGAQTYDYQWTIPIKHPSPRESSSVIKFHPIWLRHHCQCEKCYNPKTYQKMVIPSYLPSLASSIKDLKLGSNVSIQWGDGHVSTFSHAWLESVYQTLMKNESKPLAYKTLLASSAEYYLREDDHDVIINDPLNDSRTGVEYASFMKEEEGVAHLLQSIIKHGFGIVKNAPHEDPEYTKAIVQRISQPQPTIYGDFSVWTSDLAHADTAYTSDFVHLHTDTTYFSEQMGLQMFHCLEHKGTGGVNCFLDGFKLSTKLHQNCPHSHKLLSLLPIPSHYYDPKESYHFYHADVTLKHGLVDGRLERIRYNPHDMHTLDTVPFSLIGELYQSLVKLSQEIDAYVNKGRNDDDDGRGILWIKLEPGTVIFLDNWRTLHGRTEFTGFRKLCGAYISRSDWISRARYFGLK